MSFVRYKCLKDVFCTLWMSKRCHLYVMNVMETSFGHYEYLKRYFVRRGIMLKDIFWALQISKRLGTLKMYKIVFET